METSELLVLAIFVLAGLFSFVSSLLNFDWYFNSRKAATVVRLLGRGGARIFYGLLGLGLIVAGILFFFYGRAA
ncbi:hypothetical protein M2459_003497 [Parabacteroides sp. PF5-5]|uniref:immunity 17 family protein n=1 Tax=unclassified Parabacteroides TaxID=2649774 RepID=UPI0024765524|nr:MULTISPECIES: immunity 17 family protein [unclassified Parabacteroides]MDH6306876.1 hypothetical protein [Parabacteroides sp. PH5-39]MDH6317736.1 hypothetical protein [Parabacteroides sp. PF5-13]MDH6321608.1 hypothetical protein [Parabacteroides sp. PH5-13]MDH6325263.1 hypothetical protein [Parabacteroides sp. PH5-8]MDH6328921.1 hypothetical protein [Parabacteroides sp. PH5-41]